MFFGVGAVGRQSIVGKRGVQGASLDLGFMSPGVLDPRITFTRASTGTYFDSSGVMQTAAINAPRWDYDPVSLQLRGLLLEDQRTNGVRNSSASGAVPGTPGTMPTNWAVNPNTSALSSQVVATGTDNGIPYLDLRIFGTAAASNYVVYFEAVTGIPALTGQAWTFTYYWKLVAGSLNGLTGPLINLREQTSGGALVADHTSAIPSPTNASLVTQRMTQSMTLSGGATTANIRPMFFITATNAAVVDATLRLAAPQAEQGDFATSFISTTAAAVTRSIDSCLIPPVNMSPWFASPGGSWFAEFDYLRDPPMNGGRVISRADVFNATTPMQMLGTYPVSQYDGIASINSVTNTSVNTIVKGVSTWSATQAKICGNGGPVAVSALLTAGFGILATTGVRFMALNGPQSCAGHLRRVQYYPRVLTNAEMQSVTT